MRSGDVLDQRLLSRKSLCTHRALVGHYTTVILALMHLKVGLAGESLFTVIALPVLNIFMDRLDVPKKFGSVRKNIAAMGTRKPLFGHEFASLVDVVLSRSMHGQGHRGRILGRAVFAGERPLIGVLTAYVILEGDVVHKTGGEADVALSEHRGLYFLRLHKRGKRGSPGTEFWQRRTSSCAH